MELERLRLFALLIKWGSYSKTAEALGVSKGYLSKQIKELERQLKSQLLIRNTRTMRLTPAGELLFDQANKLTTFWQDTQTLIESNDDQLAGPVRFTAPTGLMKYTLMPVIESLSHTHPDLDIICETGNETFNLIKSPYDFAVRLTNTPPDDMVAKKLMTSHYVCCATEQYLAKHGIPKTPDRLAEHQIISLFYWRNWPFTQNGKTTEITVEAKYQFTDNEILKQAALNHLGIARLPKYIIQNELISGEFVPVLEDFKQESRDVYMIYPQSLNKSKRVEVVMKGIIDGLK